MQSHNAFVIACACKNVPLQKYD